MDKVVVFGNGQAGTLNYSYLTHDTSYTVTAFTVDREYIEEDELCGLPVVPFEEIESIYPPDEYKMSVVVSYRAVNRLRAEKYDQAKAKGYHLISYVSSRATILSGLDIGDNTFIGENVSIGPFVKIGNNVFIGSGSVIGHNSVIKDHCFIGPHAVVLGSTPIEPYCVIGANSTIRDGGVTIARECIVGAGSVITKDTIERGIYVSGQAELMPKRSDELTAWLTWGMK